MTETPGTPESALIAFTLVNDLLDMLREKGILTTDDVTSLLEAAADRLGKDPGFIAQRGAGFIRDSMLPKPKVV